MNARPREDIADIVADAVEDVRPYLSGALEDIDEIIKTATVICHKFGPTDLGDLEQQIALLFQWERIQNGKERADGFAGVVLIAIIGRLLDQEYNPSSDFYHIKPRPVFERYIGPILQGYGAPVRKSAALNVAKNVSRLDKNWAAGKRPQSAALAAVDLVGWVSAADIGGLNNFLRVVIWCYLALSALYGRELPSIQSGSAVKDAHLVASYLISEAPARGSTAQAIVGAVLQAQHELFQADEALSGLGESVFSTNTTSQKPGDFAELLDGQLHIYEVTTKKIDEQRLRESAEAVLEYLDSEEAPLPTVEVTFLCDLSLVEVDLQPIAGQSRSLEYHGLHYEFFDLDPWLLCAMERLGPKGRQRALEIIQEYVTSQDTELRVKQSWDKYFSDP